MFTGIVEELGEVISLAQGRLVVRCAAILHDATLGASIAVNGACLTAVELAEDRFAADLAPETLARTNLGALLPGARVNLERPLRANARLDGHFVLGHVDGVGEISELRDLGANHWWLSVRVPAGFGRYIVSKGSVAIDGISLTVAAIDGETVSFTIIPHTFAHTTLGGYQVGSKVNVELDILAKHLEKLENRGRLPDGAGFTGFSS